MRDQLILRAQLPGASALRVNAARLLEAGLGALIADFTALDDYSVYIDIDAILADKYTLAVNLANYPTLYFSVQVVGEAERSFEFMSPAPACATVTVQRASQGSAHSRTVHLVQLALPIDFEAAVLVVGADLKGGAHYIKFAETWRDDLYHGRTDLGDKPDRAIGHRIHDHTLVSLFDFRTGYVEHQVKGERGWHRMCRTRLGKQAPDIARPKSDDALERRQACECISIVDVYRHISAIGRARRACLRQLHFFSHAYLRGPVLLNTSDHSDSDVRDPTDKDPRTKDFLPVNLEEYKWLPDAFDPTSHVKSWGCFGSEMKKKLHAVARTSNLDEEVIFEGERYTSADAIRELRQFVFPDSYMIALCQTLNVDAWSLPPGTSSAYQTSKQYSYFRADPREHGAVIGWYERNFGCQRDFGGAVSYRKLV